jgi:cyclopropane-fatty-acyl-phospholipid synthase
MNATSGLTEYKGASKGAIAHHYDVSNSFMELWLDATMSYSCALWEPGDDLHRAQLRKIDYMLDLAGFAEGERLLDIGCGWGGLLKRASSRGARSAVGLTLSEEQHAWMSAWHDPAIDVHLTGWADFAGDPFDSIVSVGAFEHFARPGFSREQRVAGYEAFFARCNRLLRPGGRLALQTIARGDAPVDRQGLRDLLLIVKQMFPESDLPYPAEILLASEGHFEIEQVRNDRAHYARTCRSWLERLTASRSKAVSIAGEDVVDTYARYLEACVRQFERGHAVLLRLGLRRVDPPSDDAPSIATTFSRGRR